MKYFVIAGEASGDFHASQLIDALRTVDANSSFRFFGGDKMQNAAGIAPVVHFKHMAYMGFVEVVKHLKEILSILNIAKKAIVEFNPDAVILVDYPSFNLKIAKFAYSKKIPVFYYISPKVWAWKEYRVKDIKKYVTKLYSILPFEKQFFARHGYEILYTGNPSVKEVDEALKAIPSREEFYEKNHIYSPKPIIALLPGSRRKEIDNNLPEMLKAALQFTDYQPVIVGAPSVDKKLYTKVIKTEGSYAVPPVVYDDTFALLKYAGAALVTSGTATLETALVGTPQIACYRMSGSRWVFKLLSNIINVKYVTLPNLITDSQVIPELLLHNCTAHNIARILEPLLEDSPQRDEELEGYKQLRKILGSQDSAATAASDIVAQLREKHTRNA
ncbi:MAG: lipid-A-disaccharide synthase [Muribaculaceae bacterium]|nr:lipid-A-disaccharide synthase [Muribaculaceae bacterium]